MRRHDDRRHSSAAALEMWLQNLKKKNFFFQTDDPWAIFDLAYDTATYDTNLHATFFGRTSSRLGLRY